MRDGPEKVFEDQSMEETVMGVRSRLASDASVGVRERRALAAAVTMTAVRDERDVRGE